MKRHYYISEDLDDLERVEQELQGKGLDKPHMHVLSETILITTYQASVKIFSPYANNTNRLTRILH